MLGVGLAFVDDSNLGAVDRLQPGCLRGLCELDRAAEIVVVGQRQRAVAVSDGGVNELIGARGAVKERKGRMTVEFCVQHERMFASLRKLCGILFPPPADTAATRANSRCARASSGRFRERGRRAGSRSRRCAGNCRPAPRRRRACRQSRCGDPLFHSYERASRRRC